MKRLAWAALLLFCCWQGIGWAGSIGFLAYQDNTWSLYRWDLQHPPQKIYSDPYLRDWAISPDGKTVVYSTTEGRLWKYDIETQARIPLSPEGEDWQSPAYLSQDRLVVVKNHFTPEFDEAELMISDLSKGTIIEAIAQTGSEDYPCAHGSDIAYSLTCKLPFGEFSSTIWHANLSTSKARLLSPGDCKCIRPCFAPDGREVAWLKQAPDGWQIISKSLDGRTSPRSSPFFEGINSFIWNPDGAGFILITEDQEGTVIARLNARGEIAQRINPLDKGATLREIRYWP